MTITKTEIVQELIKMKGELWPNGGVPEHLDKLINSIFDDLKEMEQDKKADAAFIPNFPNLPPVPEIRPSVQPGIYPYSPVVLPPPRYGEPYLSPNITWGGAWQ